MSKKKNKQIKKIDDGKMIANLDKIYRVLVKLRTINNQDEAIIMSAIIYMIIFDDSSLIFEDLNINLDTICSFLRISEKKLNKFRKLRTDYNHINKNLLDICISDNNGLIVQSIENIINNLILNPNRLTYNILFQLTRFVNIDIKMLQTQIKLNGKLLVSDDDLKQYKEFPIPEIKSNNISEILKFGDELVELSDTIAKENLIILKKNNKDLEDLEKIKVIVNNIKRDPINRILSLFRKSNGENNPYYKKEILNRLDEYFKERESSLKNDLLELQHIRTLIGIYLIKADAYLKRLSEVKTSLNDEISHKDYTDIDFRVFDDRLRQQIIENKTSNINASIVNMLGQYDRITLQMGVDISLINQINIARSTTLQNLYIELSLNESIDEQKDTIDSLNELVNLLSSMSVANNNDVADNISRINAMNKDNIRSLTEQDRLLIKQVLDELGLLKETTEVQDKTKKLK